MKSKNYSRDLLLDRMTDDAQFDDPVDRPFYEVALSGEADYLVPENNNHFLGNPVV